MTTVSNINQLSPTSFRFVIDDQPDFVYNLTRVTLPGLTVGTAALPNPSNAELTSPGDKMQFEDLVVGFIIDEDLNAFKNILDWIRDNTREPVFKDVSVQILTNKRNVNRTITYHNAYPYIVSPISFDYSLAPDAPVTNDVIFKYYDFTIS